MKEKKKKDGKGVCSTSWPCYVTQRREGDEKKKTCGVATKMEKIRWSLKTCKKN